MILYYPGRESTNRLIFKLFLTWLVVSSLYYISFLFSGDVQAAVDKNFLHKAFKYLGAAFFSFVFLINASRYLLAWGMVLLLALIGSACIIKPEIIYQADLIIVLLSMFGLVIVLSRLNECESSALVKIIVASAVLVSIFSFVEICFLSGLYREYWHATGGMRSISSLYNPNNMGLHQSAAFILLVTSGLAVRYKVILSSLIGFGLIMSGSRTAWISLFIVLCALYLFNSGKLFLVRAGSAFMLFLLAIIMLMVVSYFQVLWLPERLSNFDSAYIRIERYFLFFSSFDFSYMLPDWGYSRAGLVSESGYFTLFNYFGFCAFLVLLCLAILFFKVHGSPDYLRGWKFVFMFYLVAALFENVLNSFPNNQLLFLAAGAFFIPREEFS